MRIIISAGAPPSATSTFPWSFPFAGSADVLPINASRPRPKGRRAIALPLFDLLRDFCAAVACEKRPQVPRPPRRRLFDSVIRSRPRRTLAGAHKNLFREGLVRLGPGRLRIVFQNR